MKGWQEGLQVHPSCTITLVRQNEDFLQRLSCLFLMQPYSERKGEWIWWKSIQCTWNRPICVCKLEWKTDQLRSIVYNEWGMLWKGIFCNCQSQRYNINFFPTKHDNLHQQSSPRYSCLFGHKHIIVI